MDKLLNDFSPGRFVVQPILLLLLIFIMVKFAWKPILNSLNEREEGIQGALDAAEKAKREMENLQADNQKLLQEARLEREAMLKEAREMKAQMITDAETQAQTQANKMIEQAQLAIDNEKKTAMAELKNHVANLSVDIAEKVVRQELSNKGKQLELVESMLAETTLN
jgi:F-type H+-transporting ATPase subunit b